MTAVDNDLLWPTYLAPSDLAEIERVPLSERGLPTSTYALVRRAAQQWPDRAAITVLPAGFDHDQATSWTFAELDDRVTQVANTLRAAGIDRGSAVGLLSPNVAELIVAMLGTQAAGIAAPANPTLSVETLTDLFRRAGIRALIAAGPEIDPALWSTAVRLAEVLDVRALYALRPTSARGAGPHLDAGPGRTVAYLSDAAADQPTDAPLAADPQPDHLAALFHTGGTTGAPKLAAHTHANEVADAWMVAAHGSLRDQAALFAALPLFHVNALVVTLLSPLLRGHHVVWAGPLGYRDPVLMRSFWKVVSHYRIATMSAVPTVYSALATIPVDADISSMRFAIVGASPLPPAVSAAFTEHTGVPLLEGYGLSEATCATARNLPGYPRPGSVGQRLPYQHVKVIEVDAATGDWIDLPPGRSGVLAISGPTVFAGYVAGHDGDAPILDALGTVRDGWLNTGDLARVDAEGFLYLTGRAKDVIIRGGHNIDPATIENALLSHPDVTGAQAVARPDPHAGELPIAYVTVRAGSAANPNELLSFAGRTVAEPAARPREVVVLETLPITAVGKPSKLALRRDATQRAATDALAEAGLAATVECDLVDGELITSVHTDTGKETVSAVLDRFAFRWQFRPPPQAEPKD